MSVAERLYYDAQDLLAFSAQVTDIRLESNAGGKPRWQVALDRTAFYPESGGQPWDQGTLEAVSPGGAHLVISVLQVVEEEGEVWHVVDKPVGAGTVLAGTIDALRRRDHMQQHTGQHLLSAMCFEELQAGTVSFHLGGESSTIDLALAELSREDLLCVELRVNKVIAEDRTVSATRVERSEAEAMLARGELRKLPEREGSLRLIEIEGVEWNACGGTHVASTGRIGGLTVRGVERVKAGVRVEFCCGLRAVRTARRDYDLLGEAAHLLSTGAEEIPGRIRALLAEARTSAKQRSAQMEELAGMEARLHADAGGGLVECTARDMAYARLLAAKIARLGATALVWTVEGEHATVMLAGQGLDCNAVMKAALAVTGGRGGGSVGMAQGAVPSGDSVRLVAELRARVG